MRHILISAMGRSPAILTETVYCLCVEKKVPLSEVHVLTTKDGQRSIEGELFQKGVWYDLCRDYELHDVHFGLTHIHVLKGEKEAEFEDLRTPEESERAGEQIVEFVRRKAKDPQTVLHCSVAGGRKTLGTHLAFALQLFGRPQDTLSHILVHPPDMERCKAFFYPPKESIAFEVDGREIPSASIRLDMAAIPFVRLRHILQPSWLNQPYSRLVELAQKELEDLSVCLDLSEKELVFRSEGSEMKVLLGGPKKANRPRLEPLPAAYYSSFLLKSKGHRLAKQWGTLELIRRLYEHFFHGRGTKANRIDRIDRTIKSKMNNALTEALQSCYPRAWSRALVGRERETINLPPEKIEIKGRLL